MIYFAICVIMLVLGTFLMIRGKKHAEFELVSGRLSGGAVDVDAKRGNSWLEMQLDRAGLALSGPQLKMIFIAYILLIASLAFFSLSLALLCALGILAAAYVGLTILYKRRQQKVISQLPRFLDQVQRSMQIGKTLGDSVIAAIDSCEEPIRSILLKVKRNIGLGVSLPDAFQDIADEYAIQELQILALGMRVNFRFGGSMTEFLANIINYIREQEKMRRELKAMTGETRVSAVVLSMVPVGIAAYILAKNPNYLMTMWNDDSGQNMILLALGLQITGILVIWRMLKSI